MFIFQVAKAIMFLMKNWKMKQDNKNKEIITYYPNTLGKKNHC